MSARAFALPLALLPLAAHGEGARLVFDCVDAAGAALAITIAPEALDADGAGRVAIALGEAAARPGVAATPQGPWAWSDDQDQYALMVDAAAPDGAGANLLLHRFAPGQAGTLTSYTCEAHP